MSEATTPAALAEAREQFDIVILHECAEHGHAMTMCLNDEDVPEVTKFLTECIEGVAVDRSFVNPDTGRIEADLYVLPPDCARAVLDGVEELS